MKQITLRFLAAAALLVAAHLPASAQGSASTNWCWDTIAQRATACQPTNPLSVGVGFTQTARAPDLSASNVSSRVVLGATAVTARVCNSSTTTTAYVALGNSSVTVTTANGIPVFPSSCVNLNVGSNTNLAGITASSTATLVTSLGTGVASLGSGGGGGGSTSPGGSSGQVQWNSSGAFAGITGWTTDGANALTGGAASALTVGSGGLSIVSGTLNFNGDISQAAWTTNGLRLTSTTATFTDTTSSGTVAAAYTNRLGGNTIAATNPTTYTQYETLHIAAPTAGTNVIFTNKYAIGADNVGIFPPANVTPLTLSGGSITGSSTVSPGIVSSSTINTSGKIDGVVLNAAVTDTARGGGTTFINILGGASGTTVKFAVDNSGAIQLGSNAGIADGANAAGAHWDINKINTGIVTASNFVWAWSNATGNISTLDTGLSRISAGVVGVGTGAQGSVAGTVQAAAYSANAGTSGTPGFNFSVAGGASRGLYYNGGLVVGSANAAIFAWDANNFAITGSKGFGFTAGAADSTSLDTILTRSAAATLQHGAADAAAPVAQTVRFQSVVAGTNNTAGANTTIIGSLSTGSGTSGDIIFQTGGTGAGATAQNTATSALIIKGATQLVTLPAITTDATHTDSTLCQDTTTHAIYFGSGAAGICLGTSSARFKQDIRPLKDGLAQIAALNPVSYRYKEGYGTTDKDLYGFTAEDMDQVMPKLVGHDTEGRPNSIDWAGLVPVLTKAVQELKADNDNLRQEMRALRTGTR